MRANADREGTNTGEGGRVFLLEKMTLYTLNKIGSLKENPSVRLPCSPWGALQGFSRGCIVIVLDVFFKEPMLFISNNIYQFINFFIHKHYF